MNEDPMNWIGHANEGIQKPEGGFETHAYMAGGMSAGKS
jgi:hypothetical protein